MHGSHSFTRKLHHACHYLVNIHQTALPLTCNGVHLIADYCSFINPERRKAELADIQRTVYLHKWSPISCRSSAGQRKFADQRPTFYNTTVPRSQPAPLTSSRVAAVLSYDHRYSQREIAGWRLSRTVFIYGNPYRQSSQHSATEYLTISENKFTVKQRLVPRSTFLLNGKVC